MITLHHLNNSRSQRILWMLEELGLEYEIKLYQRNAKTSLAPDELKHIHPLGRAPIITDSDIVVAESGAIIEYLAHTYAPQYIPPIGTPQHRQYCYWLHFAEGSLMTPMLVKMVLGKVKAQAKPFFVKMVAKKIVDKVMAAYFGPNLATSIDFVEQHLATNQWFAGDDISGADFQMSFQLEALCTRGLVEHCPNIKAYVKRIHARPAYQQGLKRGGQYDYA
ncbi:glutathione S-transferase family protein [Neptunicella sp. SCSIO 80796]|uniref:glutathione S-transferase family protein n=1 Tax=Neptunicella plasticusilytica TaxID=3117012 RepID=UPI003A4E147C